MYVTPCRIWMTYAVINVELPPLCSAMFRPGRPSEQAQSIGQFLNDLIKKYNSGATLSYKSVQNVFHSRTCT